MPLAFHLFTLLIGAKCSSLARLRPYYGVVYQYPTKHINKNALTQQIRMNHARGAEKSPTLHSSPGFYTPATDHGLMETQSKSTRLNGRPIFAKNKRINDRVKWHNEYVDIRNTVYESIYGNEAGYSNVITCAVAIPGLIFAQ